MTEKYKWQQDANCRETDPNLFFHDEFSGGNTIREAKEICRDCIVSDQCLEHALKNRERFGIWGGLTARERNAFLAEQNRQASLRKPVIEI